LNDTYISGLVSVIVASYNHASFLARRMDSLCSQTYKNVEIIVIDDCSPDDSRKILAEYECDPRITLINRTANAGWIEVSNQGLQLAKGEFVLFANCDDYCDDIMIEKLVFALQKNASVGVAYCRSLLVDVDGNNIGDDFNIRERSFQLKCATDSLILRCEMQKFLLKSCVIPNLSCALFHRDCFSNTKGFSADFLICSDWDLFFRISKRFDFFYVSSAHNRFRQHALTVRSAHKGKVTMDEYFEIILGNMREIEIDFRLKCRVRFEIMCLWADHILDADLKGWRDFNHHLHKVKILDVIALLFLPAGLFFKLTKRIKSKIT
jgi:glycosyltransferase involved in cell wall biosynthesis